MKSVMNLCLICLLLSCQTPEKKKTELLEYEISQLQEELDELKNKGTAEEGQEENDDQNEYDIEEFNYLFGIEKDKVGPFHRGMTLEDLYMSVPEEYIKKEVVQGEYEDEIYEDYEFYDDEGNLMLVFTPVQNGRMNAPIHTIVVKDKRYFLSGGVDLNSTYGQLVDKYNVDDYSPDMDVIVVSLDEIGASFSILKSELEEDWWGDNGIDPSKIPLSAKFNGLVIRWR